MDEVKRVGLHNGGSVDRVACQTLSCRFAFVFILRKRNLKLLSIKLHNLHKAKVTRLKIVIWFRFKAYTLKLEKVFIKYSVGSILKKHLDSGRLFSGSRTNCPIFLTNFSKKQSSEKA